MASALALFLLFNLASLHHVLAAVVKVEEGYTVTTLIDGHKLLINPHAVLPRPGSSDLLVLDSASSVVYTLSYPKSKESDFSVKKLAGDEKGGYSDGESGSARFNKPRSFAVDLKGNVYVADKTNRAIRKISNSGVTTIAGGNKTGYEDGPAQDASFSTNFEIIFVPEKCALLISDHGNQLIRQISLKAEDCARGSEFAMGAVSIWALGLGACLLGLIVWIAVPYIFPRTGRLQPPPFQHDMEEALPNPSGETSTDTLLRLKSPISRKDCVSLIDCDDISSSKITKSEIYADQLKGLIPFDGSLDLSNMDDKIFNQGDVDKEGSDVLSDRHGSVDAMIQANIMGFAELAKETTPMEGSLIATNSGLVKRRCK
ncbi:NHL domain-containing protein [Fagus crenata]